MKTPRSITAVSVAAFVLALAACGGSGAEDDGVVRLSFRQFDPADQIEGLVEAVEAWNEEHADIQLELETLTPNNPQQFAREANSGSGPDIVHIAFADVAFLAEPSILLPLDELMAEAPLPDADSLLATEMTVLDDTTWAVPWTADTMALVYREDALADAGFDHTPSDWDELLDMAGTITDSSDGQVSGFCFAAGAPQSAAQWFAINYYMWSNDFQLIEKNGDDWTVGATEDELAGAVDFFNAFFTEGITPTSMQALTEYGDPAVIAGLGDGTCAMTYMPPAAFRAAQEQVEADLATAPMPSGLEDGATHLGGRALGINANTDHPDEAWQVVQYLLSATTFETYDQYPASASTLTQLDVDPAEQGFVDQLPHSVPFVRYIGAPITIAALQELVNQQFSAVYSGQVDSTTAARAIIESIERELQN